MRLMKYLNGSKDEVLLLSADDLHVIKWYVDASFAVHNDIEVTIATRDYQGAISLVKKAETTMNAYTSSTAGISDARRQIAHYSQIISNLLLNRLESASLSSPSVEKTIEYLVVLGYIEQAQAIFLKQRSDLIHTKLRVLPFEGNTLMFIHDYTYLFFTLFKKSIALYRKYFSLPQNSIETQPY